MPENYKAKRVGSWRRGLAHVRLYGTGNKSGVSRLFAMVTLSRHLGTCEHTDPPPSVQCREQTTKDYVEPEAVQEKTWSKSTHGGLPRKRDQSQVEGRMR